MTNNSEEEIKSHASKFAAENDADVIFINAPFYPRLHSEICCAVQRRSKLRGRVYVVLVTEGGLAEVAYRICRLLQMSYTEIVVVVPGWCKSAGTLFCLGAGRIIFGPQGELGPIDVQLRRPDEIGERDSGLAVDSAFDALQGASFKIFEQYMLGVKRKSYGAVTFKTAADIAAQVTVGLTQPILAQLDPIKVGEIHRSVRIAEEYAKRLNFLGNNVRADAPINPIQMLLRGYPSHEFVIDLLEANMLFKDVDRADGDIALLIDMLGDAAIHPIDDDQPAATYAEFLNEEVANDHEDKAAGEGERGDDQVVELPSEQSTASGDSPSVAPEGVPRVVPGRGKPGVHSRAGSETSAGKGDEAA